MFRSLTVRRRVAIVAVSRPRSLVWKERLLVHWQADESGQTWSVAVVVSVMAAVDLHDDDLPPPPSTILHLHPARLVSDVDEEIFLLYTLNAKAFHDGGLGYVNHSTDRIFVSIDGSTWTSSLSDRNLSGLIVPIYQDTTSLRSAKGNTGSVLWRSTVELAIRFREGVLFDLEQLKEARVLELGAGTGALPALLGGLSQRWLATDLDELTPLIRKNVAGTPEVKVAALDWFDFSNPPSAHTALIRKKEVLDQLEGAPDVIVACDCIYNPGLLDALIATLNVFTERNKTVVLVSCEMRSDEILADFLTRWKEAEGDWVVVSLEERFGKGFVTLAGWKG